MVPSSGSTIQRSPLLPRVSEPSSPSIPSSGRAASRRSRIELLGRDVGLGDEVGRAALRLDPQLGLERRAQLGARRAGDLLGELDQSGGTRSAHGRAASIWAASATSVASSPGRRDELHGEREAVVGEAGGHRRGRLAGVVEGRAVRHPARVAVERPQRAPALVGADRDRALGEHRRHAGRRRARRRWRSRARWRPPRRGRASSAALGIALPRRRKPLVRRDRRSGWGSLAASVGDAGEVAGGERDAGGPVRDLGAADVVAEAAQQLAHVVERALLLARRATRGSAASTVRRGGDPELAGVAADGGAERLAVAGGVEEERGVGDVAGDRAVDREAVPRLLQRRHRDAVALRLEAEEAAAAGGDADRAAAVGGERAADQAGRDRGGRAAARPAGGAVEVPRVAGDAEGRRLRERRRSPAPGTLVLPMITAPAARRRRTTSASSRAGSP